MPCVYGPKTALPGTEAKTGVNKRLIFPVLSVATPDQTPQSYTHKRIASIALALNRGVDRPECL